MSSGKIVYICRYCRHKHDTFSGQCASCGMFNALDSVTIASKGGFLPHVIGAIAAAAVLIFLLVPGLPVYIMTVGKLPAAHIPMQDFTWYDAQFTEETQIIEHDGATALVPADLTKTDTEISSLYQYEDASLMLLISRIRQEEEFKGLGKGDFIFYNALGLKSPQTYFEYDYILNSITWDDFNIRSYTAAQGFRVFATLKEDVYSEQYAGYSECYYYENNYFKGFIYVKRRIDSEPNQFICRFYTIDEVDRGVIAMIQAHDDELAWAFINSIRM